jgi:hypothetical protein
MRPLAADHTFWGLVALIAAIALLFALTGKPAGANLIDNGGFEQVYAAADPSWPYWQADAWQMGWWLEDWRAVEGEAHSGQWAAWTDPAQGYERWMVSEAWLSPGSYLVSLWAKPDRMQLGEPPTLSLRLGDSSYEWTLRPGWRLYQATLACAAPAQLGILALAPGDDSLWVDDVEATALTTHSPEPAGWLILALLAVATPLVALRRRGLLLGLLGAFLAVSASASPNLLVNGGMERGGGAYPYYVSPEWRTDTAVTGDPRWTRNGVSGGHEWPPSGYPIPVNPFYPSMVREGGYSIHTGTPYDYQGEVNAWLSYEVPIPAGTWEYSAWCYAQRVAGTTPIEMWLSSGRWGKAFELPDDQWFLLSAVFTSAQPMGFTLAWIGGGGCYIYADDLRVEAPADPMPEPGGWMAVAAGMVLVWLGRGRRGAPGRLTTLTTL